MADLHAAAFAAAEHADWRDAVRAVVPSTIGRDVHVASPDIALALTANGFDLEDPDDLALVGAVCHALWVVTWVHQRDHDPAAGDSATAVLGCVAGAMSATVAPLFVAAINRCERPDDGGGR